MSGLALQFYHRLPPAGRSAVATLRGMYLRWWRYGPDRQWLQDQALDREQWTVEQWRRWRESHLASLLHRAATRVPYYREQWAARRRAGDLASWQYLENWPVLEKEPLRTQPRAFIADDRRPARMFHEHTSGTSGKPIEIWRTRRTVETLYALAAARTRGWHGIPATARWARIGGQLVVPASQRRPPFWVWNAALGQLYMSAYHLSPALIPHYLDALRRYRIEYLAGYTSSLHALAVEALRLGRDDLHMAAAFTNAEPLPDRERETIAAAFHCPVAETYGMAETAAAASECPHGRLHQWPEVGWIEVMAGSGGSGEGRGGDEQGAESGTGDLVCTGLLNVDMPLIRYRVGDSGRVIPGDAECPCGRRLPLLAGVAGRTSDLLYTADGRRVFWLNPVFYGVAVREAQIEQETLDRVRVRYVPDASFTAATSRTISERLQARLGPGRVQVVFEAVAAIPRGPNGKFRPVICALGPEDRARVGALAATSPSVASLSVDRQNVAAR